MANKAKPAKQLINILANTRDQLPNFTLFLGAGASIESGISSGGQLIENWREQYWEAYGDGEDGDKKKFLADQSWYEEDNEYSRLFELLYDTPSQRRDFIEGVVGEQKPSWGYMYLVNLFHEEIFNTVFTTNFDDLLNEACYVYSSDVRPIVSAHDSSIRSVRLSSKRPKIIKLHGDFLFDSIKNTVRELESLELNMREKFREFSNEFGMIVVGYSGGDRSIMDSLDALLRDDRSFPHGIYWCVRKADELNPQVEQLARFPNFHLVEIDGFDSFMAELHAGLDLPDLPIFENPYEVTTQRLTSLLNELNVRAGIPKALKTGIRTLARSLQNPSTDIKELPYRLLAQVEFDAGNDKNGLEHLLSWMKQEPRASSPARVLCRELVTRWNEGVVKSFRTLVDTKVVRVIGVNDISLDLINAKRYDFAEFLLKNDEEQLFRPDEFYKLNLYQIPVHRGETLPSESEQEVLSIANNSENWLSKFGANCILRNDKEAFEIFQNHILGATISGATHTEVLSWPISQLLDKTTLTNLESLIKKLPK